MTHRHNYEHHNILYALDLVCMGLAVGLLGFCLYIAPYLLLGYQAYDVPIFIIEIAQWYETNEGLKHFMLVLAVFLPFVLGSIAFMYISRLISFFIEPPESLVESDEEVPLPKALANGPNFWKRHIPIVVVGGLMLLVVIALVITELLLVFDVFR